MTFQQFLTGLIQGLLIAGLTLLILWLLGANTQGVL